MPVSFYLQTQHKFDRTPRIAFRIQRSNRSTAYLSVRCAFDTLRCSKSRPSIDRADRESDSDRLPAVVRQRTTRQTLSIRSQRSRTVRLFRLHRVCFRTIRAAVSSLFPGAIPRRIGSCTRQSAAGRFGLFLRPQWRSHCRARRHRHRMCCRRFPIHPCSQQRRTHRRFPRWELLFQTLSRCPPHARSSSGHDHVARSRDPRYTDPHADHQCFAPQALRTDAIRPDTPVEKAETPQPSVTKRAETIPPYGGNFAPINRYIPPLFRSRRLCHFSESAQISIPDSIHRSAPESVYVCHPRKEATQARPYPTTHGRIPIRHVGFSSNSYGFLASSSDPRVCTLRTCVLYPRLMV